jgi:hypothetical protein
MSSNGANGLPPLAPLPDPVHPEITLFERCMTELLRVIGIHLPDVRAGDPADLVERRLRRLGLPEQVMLRRRIRLALDERQQLPEPLFEPLMRAAVYDPNPSFNRQFVEPAMIAFGPRRVQEAILGYLTTGTNPERAGAARAWYWADVLGWGVEETGAPPESQAELLDARADLRTRWIAAALREFVDNDDLDVRRCLLPGLPLHPAVHPEESHGLVAMAVHIARTHPDDYLRHRVEIQVRDDII